ncbi:hypothetical protein LTR56_013214 [Elasticomyces elasticus]|nr:hypothetical protein LTR56_013214 [Elasticomyces elasticus]KAK3650071.1 hypothetical protein LTR22_012666 [Elasticomyces elasticus]KAK4920094.1 hypothetical protein LTR49_012355 [Elasticomyces elasticus]KAK5757182.1 hypothetical protein LTS12_012698 [Elasticomyces elasticus]
MALTSSDERLRGNQASEDCTAAINKANEVHTEYDKARSELARLQQLPGGLLNPGLIEDEARQELIATEERIAHHGAIAEQLNTENEKVKDIAARVNTTIDNIGVVKPGPSKTRAIQLRRKFRVFLNDTYDIRRPDELDGLENIKLLGMGMGAMSRLEASESFTLEELREVMDDQESESWSMDEVFRMARQHRRNAVTYAAQLQEMEALRTEKEELAGKVTDGDAEVKKLQDRVQELEKKVGGMKLETEKCVENFCKVACAAVPRMHTASSSALEWTLSVVSMASQPLSGPAENAMRTLWIRTCCTFDPDATLQDTEFCLALVAKGCQASVQILKYVLAASKMFATNFEGTAEVSRSAIMAMLRVMELAFRMGRAWTELEEVWQRLDYSAPLRRFCWLWLDDLDMIADETDKKVKWMEEHGTHDQKRSLTPYGTGVVLIDRKNSFVAVFKDEELSVRHEVMAGITWVSFNGMRRDWEQACTEVQAFGIRTDLKGDIWIAKHLTGASRRNADEVFGTSKYR